MGDSPPSSPPPESIPSSPIASFPPSSPPVAAVSSVKETVWNPWKTQRTWEGFATDSEVERHPSRSTFYNWNRSSHNQPMDAEASDINYPHPLMAETHEHDSLLSVPSPGSQPLCSQSLPLSHPSLHSHPSPSNQHAEQVNNLIFEEVYQPLDDMSSNATFNSDLSNSSLSSDKSSFASSNRSDSETSGQQSPSDEGPDLVLFDAYDVDARSDVSDRSCVHEESELESASVPLYNGCKHTVDEAVLDIFDNHIQNKKTQKSLADQLSYFNKYLPKPNNMPKTLYHLFKYVKDLAPIYKETTHFYCCECLSYLFTDKNEGSCNRCPDSPQQKTFYTFSVEDRLRYYFEKFRIFEHFETYENKENVIRDVSDGMEYKRVQGGDAYSVTLMLNTDGVALSHSSQTSLYPVLYVICELPPHLRASYVIVCGVWCDDKKPPINMFLRPLVETLNTLHSEGGFAWEHPDTRLHLKSSVHAPLMCADAPVTALIQNIQGHNSKYGCNTCKQKTEKIPFTDAENVQLAQGKKIKRKRSFMFKEKPARLRTGERMERQAFKAHTRKQPVKGVVGPAVFSLVSYLNISTFVFGEYLHLICSGVVRRFLDLWFHVPGPWSISHHIKHVDKFLCLISPPSFIGRLPRGASDMKHWKGSEYRAWLLFYSLPAVHNILPRVYFQHWSLIVMAVYTLLQEEITLTKNEAAETMIRLFVRDIGVLYRQQDYVYNVLYGSLQLSYLKALMKYSQSLFTALKIKERNWLTV